MYSFLKNHTSALIIGVLGSAVFVYFLEPILTWAGSKLLVLYGYTSQLLVDQMFLRASLQTMDRYGYLIITIVLILIMTSMLMVVGIVVLIDRYFATKFKELDDEPESETPHLGSGPIK